MEQLAVEDQTITRRMLKRAFLIPLTSMIFLIAILGFLILQLMAAHSALQQTDLVIAQGYKTQKLMLDSETGLRGFFLTLNPVFLEPYDSAIQELPEAFTNLRKLVADNPQGLRLAARVEAASTEWLNYSVESLKKQRLSSPDYLAKLRAGEGKKRMDEIRVLFNQLVSDQEELKSARNARMNYMLYVLSSVGVGLCLFIAAFLTLTARRIFSQLLKIYSSALSDGNQKSDKRIQASEERFRLYAETMPQMAFIVDGRGDIVYYNQRWYDYVGVKNTEGWGWKPILPPEDLQMVIDRWQQSLVTGEPYEMEYKLRRFDGEFRWHLGRALPVKDVLYSTEMRSPDQTRAASRKLKTSSTFALFTKLSLRLQKCR